MRTTTLSTSSWLAALVVGLVVLGGPSFDASFDASYNAAHAQESGEAQQPAKAPKLSDEEIAKLDECRALASSSKRLRAQVKNDLRAEIQQDDANMTMRNKKHVVMAYAALWILAVGFLVLMFLRQRGLISEITRLQREVAAAVADEEQE